MRTLNYDEDNTLHALLRVITENDVPEYIRLSSINHMINMLDDIKVQAEDTIPF